MKNRVCVLVGVVGTLALASGAMADEGQWQTPRVHLTLSGGVSDFRGGDRGAFTPFQPDDNSPTGEASLAFRLFQHLALEANLAGSRGRNRNGLDMPDNWFFGGGLKSPWPIGRFVPYVTAGGGVVQRHVRDQFESVVESAFGIGRTDPFAYAGGGLEVRATRLLGFRGDYRYQRIYPGKIKDFDFNRQHYNAHRVTGGVTFSF